MSAQLQVLRCAQEGRCISSPNFPNSYGNGEICLIFAGRHAGGIAAMQEASPLRSASTP